MDNYKMREEAAREETRAEEETVAMAEKKAEEGIPALRAILFDFDGVLLDSESMHYVAIREMLQKRGRDLPVEKFLTYCGTRESFMWPDMFRWAGLDEEPVELLGRERWELYLQKRRERSPLFEGTKELLKSCVEEGLLLAVASGTDTSILEKDLASFGYLPYFRQLVCARECERGKPAPDVFLLAARRLGVSPRECLVIEDSRNGMLAGKAGGMSVVGFSGASIPTDMSEAPVSFQDYRQISPSLLRLWHREQQGEKKP